MSKIGAGHAQAMARQGLREARSALYPESNVAQQVSEYGLYGTLTPGEVAEARENSGLNMEQERPKQESILGNSLEQSANRQAQERQPRENAMER